MLGISSILLETSALLSGIISNTGNEVLIRLIFILILLVVGLAAISLYAYQKTGDTTKVDKGNVMVSDNCIVKEVSTIGRKNLLSVAIILPSILAFTAFFTFILNIGYAVQGSISPFHIGIIIFSLAFAFPLGSIIAQPISQKFSYQGAMLIFTIFPILGILLQAVGMMNSIWLYLLFGACLMAIGNGGIITINSAKSIIDVCSDPSRPPLLYMVSAMVTTTLSGFISYTISDKLIFNLTMLLFYILILIYVICPHKKLLEKIYANQ
ncbi:MFS transporter [Facilibium subflavum]|uniref:hypothetical protein n=1 Tax=Facilibium subflavum TaxID=2219058 RepID=UPI000E6544D3|nr:hypothetical protein [Facilibium subflavum]